MSDFPSFAKIPRLNKPIVITEKIDGTNALIEVEESSHHKRISLDDGDLLPVRYNGDFTYIESPVDQQTYRIRAGSRRRWIGLASGDNYGFAEWVRQNAAELCQLGPGLHYGEWFGKGINRAYGLEERRFALFNVGRWFDPREDFEGGDWAPDAKECPPCCTVVPVIGIAQDGSRLSDAVGDATSALCEFGSYAVLDYWRPEGLIVWHEAARQYFKVIFGSDEPKSARAA